MDEEKKCETCGQVLPAEESEATPEAEAQE